MSSAPMSPLRSSTARAPTGGRRWRLSVLALLAALPLAACETPTDADRCAFAEDGVCDEPASCPLGTDSTDCEAACAAGTTPWLLGAACGHRAPPPPPRREPGEGTGGQVHLTGHRDGTLAVPSGEDAQEIVERHYRLYVPDTYDPAVPAPLVINMAGHRVDHYTLANYTELQRTADTNRFIVVYAEQQWRWPSLRWAWWTDWNWQSRPDDNPDLLFLTRLIERIGEQYNVDKSRVFTSGHSRGGAMALIAALELPHLIAGGCSQSGFSELGYEARVEAYEGRRVPLYFFHGVDDPDVCIDCVPGGTCGLQPSRGCNTVTGSDGLVATLQDKGWTDEELIYRRLDGVTHRWQPELNQEWWDFLSARPLPDVGGAP